MKSSFRLGVPKSIIPRDKHVIEKNIEQFEGTICEGPTNESSNSITPENKNRFFITNTNQVDVACITEHLASGEILDRLNIGNYIVPENFSRDVIYGRVAILVKKQLKYNTITKVNELSISNNVEMSAILTKNMFLMTVYRPPRGNMELFFSALQESLEEVTCVDNFFLNLDTSYEADTFDPHLSDHWAKK
ncbi:hypothetical protein HHI36_010448 [Cryptolaemus montrouzieri]|uniref:Uncharacterized protein n=1 Tax=Cryptolaemus montrouzieri TaxID=559131 RepID=A0ABD2MIV7_9CUCU